MSLYREPGRRRLWPAVVAAVVLVLDPAGTREAETTLNEVAAIVERRESAAELEAAVREAERAVRGLPTAR